MLNVATYTMLEKPTFPMALHSLSVDTTLGPILTLVFPIAALVISNKVGVGFTFVTVFIIVIQYDQPLQTTQTCV